MTIKKRGCAAACVLRLDDVILLTGQGFTKDAAPSRSHFLSLQHVYNI